MENIIMIAATVAIAIPVAALLDAAVTAMVESANHKVTPDAHKATGKELDFDAYWSEAKGATLLRLTNFIVCDTCEGKGSHVSRNHGTTLCRKCLEDLLRRDIIEFNRGDYVPQEVYYADLYAEDAVQDEPINVLICTCGCEYIDSKGRCARCNAIVDIDTYVDATMIECNGCGHMIPLTELKGDGECNVCSANEADWAELDEEVGRLGGLGGPSDLIRCANCHNNAYSAEDVCCWPFDVLSVPAAQIAQDIEDGFAVDQIDETRKRHGKLVKKARVIKVPTYFDYHGETLDVTTLVWDFAPRARQPKGNKKADRRATRAFKQARAQKGWGMLQAELNNEAFYAELPELTADLF